MHPQTDATYRVFPLEDGSFGIEVITPEAEPGVVKSFATVADAEAWIAEQKKRVAAGRSPGRRFRGAPAQHPVSG